MKYISFMIVLFISFPSWGCVNKIPVMEPIGIVCMSDIQYKNYTENMKALPVISLRYIFGTTHIPKLAGKIIKTCIYNLPHTLHPMKATNRLQYGYRCD